MNVSVVVPAYNSDGTLEPCLASLREAAEEGDEIIVVDDGSVGENTAAIARKYADKVVGHEKNFGRSQARNTGVGHSSGEVLLFVDSDVVVRPDAVRRVKSYFDRHKDVDALSGLLSKEHPHPGFFSQYKNLYMNYIFGKLPERVSFLYGSIHAVRRQVILPYGADVKIADDTALGQQLASQGRGIAFLKDLEVIHLKKYDFLSLVKNDFIIPFDWTKLFLRYRGWAQLGRNKSGYLHSPKEQLVSVALAPTILCLSFLALFFPAALPLPVILLLIWGALNARFVAFLGRERGSFFGLVSLFFTFFDHLVMAAGILSGFVKHGRNAR